MDKFPYEVGTDEAAARLGLSPRSVRRLGEKGILEGRVEITSVGKQWFFKKESVESLVRAREEKLKREERNRVAKDTLGHLPGQPRTTEDTTEVSRTPPPPDSERVEFLEKLLEDERQEHARTKEKLEQKESSLLNEATRAARLEGEKEAYQKYAVEMRDHQRQLMGILKDTVLKIQSPSTGDSFGHDTRDNLRQPRTTEVMTEHEEKFNSEAKPQIIHEQAGEEAHQTPSESPQNDERGDSRPAEHPMPETPTGGNPAEEISVSEDLSTPPLNRKEV